MHQPLRVPLLTTAVVFLMVGLAAPHVLDADGRITTYFLTGDCLTLMAMAPALALSGVGFAPAALLRWPALALRSGWVALALAGSVIGLSLAGTALLHGGFPLSYDEVMAAFDARIFQAGRLIAPVSPDWRPYLAALAPHFLLPVPGNAAWVSSYLPVNAMLRAAFGLLGLSALTGPALAGLAVLAVMGIARRLWPGRPDAALVSGLLLATAPQVLVTATTAYAMTAHLALNLVWFWFFLRGGRLGHCGAALVGFLASGLHQIAFHPLFAFPFLVGLALQRRWGLAAFYVAAYGLTGLVWTFYWRWVLAATGVGAESAAALVGGPDLLARVVLLLRAFDWSGLDLMAKNLVRFVAWQNPLLLPFAALAWPAVRDGKDLARPLAAGLLLMLGVAFVLMPYQGHGWGYRYLHGFIGSACLLATQGWVAATRALDVRARVAACTAVAIGCAAALLIALPLQVVGAYGLAGPSAAAVAAIAGTDADIVLVHDRVFALGDDVVRNAPDLSNRPKVLLLQRLDAAQILALCERGTVALFGAGEAAKAGFLPMPDAVDPAWETVRAALASPGCRRRAG